MTIRLSRAEYWLLDMAIYNGIPISDIVDGDASLFENRTAHACSYEEIAEGLNRLFQDRFIFAGKIKGRRSRRYLCPNEIHTELKRPKLPPKPDDPMQIRIRHPDEAFYRLTAKGGAAWEEFARPNWNIFFRNDGMRGSFDQATQQEKPHCFGQLFCPDRSRLERFVRLAYHIGYHIEETTLRWDVVSPWKATYWKTLPSAHRVRFRMVHHDEQLSLYYSQDQIAMITSGWYRWES